MHGGVVWHDMACLIVIYDCFSTYKEAIILVGMLVNDDINLHVEFVVMSVSIPPRKITTLLFQPYTYDWVMLLFVLYDSVILVQITWYTDDSERTFVMMMSCRYQYQSSMSGAMNNVLSDRNHTNNNNTSTPSSSLSMGTI